MNTKTLIDAMADGKSVDMEQAFNSIVAEKIAGKLEDMKLNMAQTMFKSKVEETTGEE
jgi:hypothetical protein